MIAESARKILFGIAGVGLGNSTRCLAVIEELRKLNFEVHVASYGQGFEFFKDRPEIKGLHRLPDVKYAGSIDSGISIFQLIVGLPLTLWRLLSIQFTLWSLIRKIGPDLIVLDSVYLPFGNQGIPCLAINNSAFVVRRFLRHPATSILTCLHFLIVECSDYLYHRIFLKMVLVPVPETEFSSDDQFRAVGLIVRQLPENIAPTDSLLINLSGSCSKSKIERDLNFWRAQLPTMEVATYQDPKNNLSDLARHRLWVTNAGCSALSEALALGRYCIIFPIANHAEQFVNARWAEELKCGSIYAERLSAPPSEAFLCGVLNAKIARLPASGAQKIAELILNELNQITNERPLRASAGVPLRRNESTFS